MFPERTRLGMFPPWSLLEDDGLLNLGIIGLGIHCLALSFYVDSFLFFCGLFLDLDYGGRHRGIARLRRNRHPQPTLSRLAF